MTKVLPYELTGNRNSQQLIVFLHGFPETTAIWDPIISPLEKDYYILNISYPNYSPKEINPKGVDITEIIQRIKFTIDTVNDTNRKVIAVAHDWGAIFTYSLDKAHPNYFTEIISLDVGPMPKITLFVILYPLILVLAFIIGGRIGNYMTHFLLKLVTFKPAWLSRIDCTWNYPYYSVYKHVFKVMGNIKKLPFGAYKPSCNVVFAWGANKSLQFFNDAWIRMLKENPNNEIHSVNSGHWIMLDQPRFLIDLIRRRVGYIKNASNTR